MPKAKKEIIEKAFAMYRQGLKLKEIAEQLNIPQGTIRSWKNRNHWDEMLQQKKCNVAKKGGQPNNKNAVGHGAPERNTNAVKHGLFSKYLPKQSLDIIDSLVDKSPLDLIWDTIQIQYAAIIRAQQIMYVEDRNDKTVEVIGTSDFDNGSSETLNIQQAWDKQANFLKAQSKAVDSLKNMIKDYLELEGKSKVDASATATDWKTAIIEIAKRRAEKNE